jgi:hypothetical protein
VKNSAKSIFDNIGPRIPSHIIVYLSVTINKMRWLNKEALSPLSDDFSQVQNLLKNEDPEDNPYKSKYEARKILEKIKLEASF